MPLRQLIAASLLAVVATGSAIAHADTPRVDQRQGQQMSRIRQGIVNGQITRHEAVQLRHEQRAIARLERRIKADGVVTPHERRVLHRAQARASRHIAHEAHDRQTRRR